MVTPSARARLIRDALKSGATQRPGVAGGGGTNAGQAPEEEDVSIMVHLGLISPGSGECLSLGKSTDDVPSAEPLAQYLCTRNGMIQRGRVRVRANSINEQTTVTIRINGVNTALSVNIPGNTVGDFPIPGSVPILDGQKVSVKVTGAATGGGQALAVSYEIV